MGPRTGRRSLLGKVVSAVGTVQLLLLMLLVRNRRFMLLKGTVTYCARWRGHGNAVVLHMQGCELAEND